MLFRPGAYQNILRMTAAAPFRTANSVMDLEDLFDLEQYSKVGCYDEDVGDVRLPQMVVSSYKAIHGMNITNVSEVSFNCQAIKGSHHGFFLFHPWKAFE